jgi:predicted enzyme related to lactoylglutathione lyase
MFTYAKQSGGGIRPADEGEAPGSLPYVHVADTQGAFDRAIREGAEVVAPPDRVMEGVTIAIVLAPGGVKIGLSGP